MKIQDEKKKEAIFDATIKLVNKIGFAAASVAKIAKEANVSPATIYIYHKSKEDLLTSIYIELKRKKSSASMEGFDESAPLKESLRNLWSNSFKFVSEHEDYLQYIEQFTNSPYNDRVDDTKGGEIFQPFLAALDAAAKERIIKEVDSDILAAFIFHPITILSNIRASRNFRVTRKNIEAAFEMAWDAIRR